MKEFTDGESNFTALLQRAMEMEGVDRETLHQLVFLLMKVSLSIDLCCAAVCPLSYVSRFLLYSNSTLVVMLMGLILLSYLGSFAL